MEKRVESVMAKGEEDYSQSRLTTSLGQAVAELGILRTDDVRELRQGILDQVMGQVGSSLTVALQSAGVLNNADLERLLGASEKKQMKEIEEKIAARSEGVRKRLQHLTDYAMNLKRETTQLKEEVHMISDQVFGYKRAEGSSSEPDDEDSDLDGEGEDNIEEFRRRLAVGMPVHFGGLRQRADLDGCAGWLRSWHEDKGRWQVEVGSEILLLRPENIFP